ncbi:hypothetical protein ACSBL2_18945 [Pedobacter sp. AW31-3R]|uniref:hypothetical protein n=1 Tax=Pedobacter sp. AW31-3R TaxID=3445781 RepID=UPI003FA0F532
MGQILPYAYQNKVTGALRKIAKANKNVNFLGLWAGQSLHGFPGDSTTVILQKLIRDMDQY